MVLPRLQCLFGNQNINLSNLNSGTVSVTIQAPLMDRYPVALWEQQLFYSGKCRREFHIRTFPLEN
jgi:hypothetical protein